MTDTPKNIVAKAKKLAEDSAESTRKQLRRNTLAYIGLHGVAYEQAQERLAEFRTNRKDFFESLVKKGEEIEAQAAGIFSNVKDKAEDKVHETSDRIWDMMPGATVNRVEELEAELAAAKAKLEKLNKSTKATVKKAKAKAVKTVKTAATKTASKVAAKPAEKAAAQTKAKPKSASKPAQTAAATKTADTAKSDEARHIPYFNDVKRYDPLANEDVVRKIVNHCGIALRSDDARFVACSDEAERNRVRDSWLKKKLEVTGTDVELDKKVQNICSIMQRDNRKNRVTFYYLAAKAERKLDVL